MTSQGNHLSLECELVRLSLGSHEDQDSEENVSEHDNEQEEAQDDAEQEQRHGMTLDEYAAFASLFQGHVIDSTYQVGLQVRRHDHLYLNTSLPKGKVAKDEEEEEEDDKMVIWVLVTTVVEWDWKALNVKTAKTWQCNTLVKLKMKMRTPFSLRRELTTIQEPAQNVQALEG